MSKEVKSIFSIDARQLLSAAEDALKENPELFEQFLKDICCNNGNYREKLLETQQKDLGSIIKDGLKAQEKLIVNYGGNPAYDYKESRKKLKANEL